MLTLTSVQVNGESAVEASRMEEPVGLPGTPK